MRETFYGVSCSRCSSGKRFFQYEGDAEEFINRKIPCVPADTVKELVEKFKTQFDTMNQQMMNNEVTIQRWKEDLDELIQGMEP